MWRLFLLGLLMAGLTVQARGKGAESPGFDPDRIRQHLEYLGSDRLGGRAVGTEGESLAARYIADRLSEYGLQPGMEGGGFLQAVPMLGSCPLPGSRLLLVQKGNLIDFQLESDYLLYRTGAQTLLPQPAPLVFAGYGIAAPEYDYNDYLSLDVAGKVVVVLLGEPGSSDPGFFDGGKATIYSYAEAKHRMAMARGAKGIILIPGLGEEGYKGWDYWMREFAFEHVTLPFDAVGNLSLLMNPQSARILFRGAEHPLEEVLAMARGGDLKGFPLVGGVSFQGQFQQREFVSANVIGVVRAARSELADRYLLVSSHYDHLGIGPAVHGDSIYNGVYDNAAGVAVTLELARVLKARLADLKRSVIFVFSTGEEKGLLGARFYVEDPVVPLFQTVANLNIDGIPLWDRFRSLIGIGAELSTLGEDLRLLAGRQGYAVDLLGGLLSEHQVFSLSDQVAFAEAGIPSILILEGMEHENLSREAFLAKVLEWSREIYHSPFDDLNQELNLAAAKQHAEFLCEFLVELSGAEAEPQWMPGVPFATARLQSIAERR